MATIRGCDLPEGLHYLVGSHVWARHMGDGIVQIGITPAGTKLAGGKLVAVTVRGRLVGQPVTRGKSVAMVESAKWVGGVPAPFDGVLVRGNDAVTRDPGLAVRDPYGDGWIVELMCDDWPAAAAGMQTGEEALAAYQALLEQHNITCE